MALIAEDGSVVAGAESYAPVAAADIYFSDRGNALWASMTTVEKEQALRRATDFMMGRYRGRWKGARVHARQELDWPRQGVQTDDMGGAPAPYYAFVVDYRTMPKEIVRACCEFAIRAAAGPLLPDQEQKIIQETIGPITIKYDPFGTANIKYNQIDEMLAVYLGRGGESAMVKLFRS